MTIKELAQLVSLMREAQKGYFKTRATGWLNQSKKLERMVDGEVKKILTDQEEQKGIFDEQ